MAMQRARVRFEEAYDEYSGMVYRTALRVLGNPVQAQDVVQDVFLRLWRHPDRFDAARGTLANYLRLMSRSRALDVWREGQIAGRANDKLKVLAERDEERTADRPAQVVELRRERTIVLRALARIPEDQRGAIVMAYWGGLTADEIAARCGVPVGTIKSRIRLGLIKLRERCELPLIGDPAAAGRQLAA